MLLICKPQGKKGDKMKVSKQPLFVERIVCSELGKETTSFGIVYLNEFRTAVAAFSFHTNNEPGVARQWIEGIKRAQAIYRQAREKVQVGSKDGEEDANMAAAYPFTCLTSRSPRGGDSSRGSQISSLIHSHSGSIEISEPCILPTRAISFEQELRGSSLSSDEGVLPTVEGNTASNTCFDETPNPLSARSSSPRIERRYMSKSPTPNMLTVNMPTRGLSGHSLPDLSAMPDSTTPLHHCQHLSLTVPKSPLSPTQRGISYPPPSSRSLCRSQAILCTPLLKGRNVHSTETVSSWPSSELQPPEQQHTSAQDNSSSKNLGTQVHNSPARNPSLAQPLLSTARVTRARTGLLAATLRSASSDSSATDSTFFPGNIVSIPNPKIPTKNSDILQKAPDKISTELLVTGKTSSGLESSSFHPSAPRSHDDEKLESTQSPPLGRDARAARQKFFSSASYDKTNITEQVKLKKQLAIHPHNDDSKTTISCGDSAVPKSSPGNDGTSSSTNESAQCAVCIAVCEPDQIMPVYPC